MITNSDLNISNESYIHKDFYQIYPEVVKLVQDLTTSWDPQNTNESDPGVILLKIAAFIADKLNYNIDKNILEVFITSATQDEAVRKICDMMGYNIKYYNSATVDVSFMWTGDQLADGAITTPTSKIIIPKFTTVLTNDAKDISYVLTEDLILTNRYFTKSIPAIEGDFVTVSMNTDNIIRISNIDDRNRFYFPETMVAENGVWIYQAGENDNREWKKVDNLNTQLKGSLVWKFGYDSSKQLPYIQFPDDYVDLFTEGVHIYYIRTSGNAGNIKSNTLTQLSNSSVDILSNTAFSDVIEEDVDSTQYLIVKNLYATNNGCDIEDINEAYNGFKKTVGVFDTLVTCRDYANAIWKMVVNEKTDNTPLVSNCQVSDIRDDINFANTVVKFNSLGTVYDNVAKDTYTQETVYYDPKGEVPVGTNLYVKKPAMDDFDLYLYPLNPIKNAYTKSTYINSFKPLDPSVNDTFVEIKSNLEDYKTISHKIKQVPVGKIDSDDVYLYKNYYSLKAKIITTTKVNKFEIAQIKSNIYEELYKNFNARALEYGEEIPYDILLSVIENADPRIKTVFLDEPEVNAKFMFGNGDEIDLKYEEDATDKQNKHYFEYIARNILAGKVPLFNYNKDIELNFNEINCDDNKVYGAINNYPNTSSEYPDLDKCSVTYISTNLGIHYPNNLNKFTLGKNEGIQLVNSKLITSVTYPMYVNYYWVKQGGDDIPANTAYKLTQGDVLYINYTDTDKVENWIKYYYDGEKYLEKTWRNGSQIASSTKEFSGIIEANFVLKDSAKERTAQPPREWSKSKQKAGSEWTAPSEITIDGLFSLKTSQEIGIKDYTKAAIKTEALIYWLSNNNNQLTFIKTNAEENIYEYILGDGEYFFYTNAAKTDLITLGSGTHLIYHANAYESTEDTITWSLSQEESITKDDIAQNGIGAFADSDWIFKYWDDENYLETEQMDIITLSENDEISSLELKTDINYIDSTKWYELDNITYTQNGETNKINSGLNTWKLKPVLNLNLGPNSIQTLRKYTPQYCNCEIEHTIALYTNYYTLKDDWKVLDNKTVAKYKEQDPKKLQEHIYTDPIVTFTANDIESGDEEDFKCLKSNLLVQKTGGEYLSVHTLDLNGSSKDNLTIYPMFDALPLYVYPLQNGNNEYVELNVKQGISFTAMNAKVKADPARYKDNPYVLLPIYIPADNYALVTLYYVAEETKYMNIYTTDGEGNVRVSESGESNNILSTYPNLFKGDESDNLEKLYPGLHIIKIDGIENTSSDKIIYLKITGSGNGDEPGDKALQGKVNILNQYLVDYSTEKKENPDLPYQEYTGLNYKIFDIPADKCNNLVNDYIQDKYKDFYATVNIDNSMLLDVDKLSSAEALFNYNNAVNKFVLAELDVSSFDNIEIASSSKL